MDLARERARRWWLERAQIRTLGKAAAFIDDVGFAMLWPKKGHPMPSLWGAGSERGADIHVEWGPDAERMWGWKDELPKRRLAWYGPFLRGGKSFLSKSLLADLYPRAGTTDDYRSVEQSKLARRIADILSADGPQSAALLREATGARGPEFSKAAVELGRALIITHSGVEEQGSGWPSAVYDLTARAFKPKPKGTAVERKRRAARRFLDTMIAASPSDLARAFNWTSADARATLDELVDSGEASSERVGHFPRYRLAR